jgi:hypothetical protein
MGTLGRVAFDAVRELAVGSLFCLTLIPLGPVRRGFFRTCVLVLACVVGLEAWLYPTPGSLVLLASLLVYGGSLWLRNDRWPMLVLRAALAVAVGAALLPSPLSAGTRVLSWHGAVQVTATLTSTFLLGSVLIGMLLGHYYLRAPDLSVTLIRRLANLFLLATVAQGLLLLVNVGLVYGAGGSAMGLVSAAYGPAVLGRVLVGVLGSFIFACVIWDTLRIPNVQAATGFFYIAILTVMIGEFLGRYLWHSTTIRF